MAVTLPPLSLSSGPAVSGGPTSGGVSGTGDFTVTRERTADRLAAAVPVIVIGVLAWWLTRK